MALYSYLHDLISTYIYLVFNKLQLSNLFLNTNNKHLTPTLVNYLQRKNCYVTRK